MPAASDIQGPRFSSAAQPHFPAAAGLLVITLIVVPKAGIQLGPAPISWGYMLLGLIGGLSFLAQLYTGQVSLNRFLAWLATLPFGALFIFSIAVNGYTDTGFAISALTGFVILPLIILLGFDRHIAANNIDTIIDWVAKAASFVAIAGIPLFGLFLLTGILPEIPFITSIGFQEISWQEKSNDRGGVFKLMSTFANGNLFGICMLMLGPLVITRRSKMEGVLFRLALLLTLSRTIFIGLILQELYLLLSRPKKITFPFWAAGAMLMLVFAAIGFLAILDNNLSFFFDSNLGGRASTLRNFEEAYFLSMEPFRVIPEIVYAGIVKFFGWGGLVLFLIALIGPIVIGRILGEPFQGDRQALVAGLGIYLILCMSDGAMQLIPVMAYFWFIIAAITTPSSSQVSTK